MWFIETAGFAPCPVLDRARLRWGNIVPGPAVIEELDATTLVHPGYQATVDQYGNLLLRRCEGRHILSPLPGGEDFITG